MSNLHLGELAPEYIRRIAPYQPGKPISELARELGLTDIVKLASNENPRGPSPAVIEAVTSAVQDLTRYPDGAGFELKAALAARHGVAPERIVIGNGSNDVLELVTLAFLRPGLEAVYSQHAFAVYPLATQARGATGVEVPARAYGHDLAAMRAAITPRTRVAFIANPNNPTGTWLPPAEVERFLATVPPEVLVVLDEAYDEYLPAAQRADSLSWLARFPNLVLSRTFSKAYGLAALRVGYGLMDAEVAAMLDRVRQPFNVNSLGQVAAVVALGDQAYVAQSAELNARGLRQLERGLDAMGVGYIPPHGNFLCVHVGDGAGVYRRLLERGVIVRPVGGYGLPGHLRVTVGLPEENDRFLGALAAVLGR